MTLETLMARLRHDLSQSAEPVDVRRFVASYFPNDIEAGSLLMSAFDARLLRGRLSTNLVEFDGHVSAIIDDTRPVWH